MTLSPILKARLLEESQGSTPLTANEYFRRIEHAAALNVVSRTVVDESALSPTEGDVYIIGTGTLLGEWATAFKDDGNPVASGDIAYYNNGWKYMAPVGCMQAFITAEKLVMSYNPVESLWHPLQDVWLTTEHFTGKYSVTSGKKIYARAYTSAAFGSSAGTTMIPHGVATLKFNDHQLIVGVIAPVSEPGAGLTLPVPQFNMTTGISIDIFCNASNILVSYNVGIAAWKARLRFEYVKD